MRNCTLYKTSFLIWFCHELCLNDNPIVSFFNETGRRPSKAWEGEAKYPRQKQLKSQGNITQIPVKNQKSKLGYWVSEKSQPLLFVSMCVSQVDPHHTQQQESILASFAMPAHTATSISFLLSFGPWFNVYSQHVNTEVIWGISRLKSTVHWAQKKKRCLANVRKYTFLFGKTDRGSVLTMGEGVYRNPLPFPPDLSKELRAIS